MNNRCKIVWRSMHARTVHVNQRCRVCGRILMEAREKKTRCSYKCKEFASDLHSVLAISTGDDIMGTHPPSFCYHCKLVMDRYLIATDQHRYTVCITPFEWKVHTAVNCKVFMCMQDYTIYTGSCHPKQPPKVSTLSGRPTTLSPHKNNC